MLRGTLLKGIGTLTLFFFMFFLFAPDFLSAQKEDDVLLKARRLYQQGDYENSIKMLSDFIAKLRAMVEQKKNVAEAFYLLGKIYYEVGDDAKVDENLTRCFDTFPAFTMDEPNLGFKDRVDKIRKEVLEDKTRGREGKPTIEPEEYPVQKKVIEQPSPIKKKKKFPVLLVVGGLVVVGVIVALAGGKKKKTEEEVFDIRSQWTLRFDVYQNIYVTFTGSQTNGTFTGYDTSYNYSGNYTVSGRQVQISFTSIQLTLTGSFSDRDNMNGSYTFVGVGTGTWSGVRGFVAADTNNTAAINAAAEKKN